MDGSQTGSNRYEKYLFSSRKCNQVDSAIVGRGDWSGKPQNIKTENNGTVVYVGSPLTVHNPLFFVQKL